MAVNSCDTFLGISKDIFNILVVLYSCLPRLTFEAAVVCLPQLFLPPSLPSFGNLYSLGADPGYKVLPPLLCLGFSHPLQPISIPLRLPIDVKNYSLPGIPQPPHLERTESRYKKDHYTYSTKTKPDIYIKNHFKHCDSRCHSQQ